MSGLNFIKLRRIVPDVRAGMWMEAFEEITAAERGGEIRNRHILINDLVFRENLASTCIGNGLAVPHAVTEGVRDRLVMFGRSPAGVVFGPGPISRANFIFIIAVTPRHQFKSIKMMQEILGFMKDPQAGKAILEASSAEEIHNIFLRGPRAAETKSNMVVRGFHGILNGRTSGRTA